MSKKLSQVLGESFRLFEKHESGYQPNRDPKMLAAEPDMQARFVAKHVADEEDDPKRPTDVDPSTLDDKLFKASNIKRAVPDGEDTHGHTPTGKDAAVYEGKIPSAKTIEKAIYGRKKDPVEGQKKFHSIGDEIKRISGLPDAHTGKYASQLNSLSKKQSKIAVDHGLNAFGKPLKENAAVGMLARAVAAKRTLDDKTDAGLDPDNPAEKLQDRIDDLVSGPSAAAQAAARAVDGSIEDDPRAIDRRSVAEQRLLEKIFSGKPEPLKNGVRDTDGKPTSDRATKVKDEEEGD